jgi:hypothetical protein
VPADCSVVGDRDDDRIRRTHIPRPDDITVAVLDRRIRFTANLSAPQNDSTGLGRAQRTSAAWVDR